MILAGIKTDLPVWLIKGEVRNETYHQLLKYICHNCRFFSMVTRDAIELSANAVKILDNLKPYLKEIREKQYEWPGTRIAQEYKQLFGKDWFEVQGATLRLYNCNKEALEYLLRITDHLYQFILPDYPEDFTCYRELDDPLLVTVSHEEIGAIIAGDKERGIIIENTPGLELVKENKYHDIAG